MTRFVHEESVFAAHEAPTLSGRLDRAPEARTPELVLVVDDDDGLREMYCVALHELGYDTIPAGTGLEALEVVRRQHPSVVLMDLAMPDMDGLRATRLMKPEQSQIFVIAMTAFGASHFAAAQAAGCDAFVCKPFNPFLIGDILEARRRPKDRPIVKTCACGARFTKEQWLTLPVVGRIAGTELRNCWCGSSLALARAH